MDGLKTCVDFGGVLASENNTIGNRTSLLNSSLGCFGVSGSG
jgi:hypothetical protein